MPKLTAAAVKARLDALGRPAAALAAARFFKTGQGQYGAGDVFIGINTPTLRAVAKSSVDLSLAETVKLLRSPIHEHRGTALMVWVMQYAAGNTADQKAIFDAYLANTRWINNWDLVDLSAPGIVGRWLETRSRRPLKRLAQSISLWERRISIVATLHFIRLGDFSSTFAVSEQLIGDPEDLIHKAVGWMLREVYKRDAKAAVAFLERHLPRLPRTSLRYAIERCDVETRKRLMARA